YASEIFMRKPWITGGILQNPDRIGRYRIIFFSVPVMKTFFLFSLLGPKVFVLLFIPSYLANVFLFATFNYFTHHKKADETYEILNLDHNLYYKFCNKTLFGVMYHKNHHLRPRLFNPMDMET
ncbi:hypothetical protein BMR06_17375, partial [Methylococcaceae bacterium HT5]